MTDATKAVVWKASYEPFGAVRSIIGSAALDIRFPGQWFQLEAGLAYNWNRHYDPTLGRYIQPDPLGFVDGPSVYGYAGQRPGMNVDPTGRQSLSITTPIQIFGSINDFWRNYRDMRGVNTIGADKYFHCKANCEAAKRGPAGERTACVISDRREWFDQNIKGFPASDSATDQVANYFGRSGALYPQSCQISCAPFRPRGLPSRY